MSASEQQVVCLKGPLHPDLFGGETPTTLKVPMEFATKAYACEVRIEPLDRYEIAATSRDEASDFALWLAREETGFDCDLEVEVVAKLDREPSMNELTEYAKWLDRR